MSLALPSERAEAALASGAVQPHGELDVHVGPIEVDGDGLQELEAAIDDLEVNVDPVEDSIGDERDDEALLQALSAALWEVEVSELAWAQWHSKGVDAGVRRDALRKLLRVAGGERAPRLSKRLTILSTPYALLFETYLERHWRPLWEEVSGPSDRGGELRVRDKIVLWGVYSHDRTQERIRHIERRIAARPRPALPPVPRPKAAAGRLWLPREFPEGAEGGPRFLSLLVLVDGPLGGAEAPTATSQHERAAARDADEAVLARVRGEAVALAAAVLEPPAGPAPQAGDPSAGEESATVAADWPCLVNGRPGAGKTSCAIVRLWAGHRVYWGLSRGHRLLSGGHYRSAFLAANPALCRRVRAALGRLRRAEEKGRREALFGRGEGPAGAPDGSDEVGADDGALEEAGVASLRDLREVQFPLCVSRDRWLRLLNATLERPFDFTADRERRVDAARFREKLWPELCPGGDGAAPAGLSADDLWLEIVSHLRGSLASLWSPDGVLETGAYLALGQLQSRLGQEQRRAAAELHARYQQLKRSPRHAVDGLPLFDHLDVVHHAFGQLRAEGYRGPAVHEVYVDEVQDWRGPSRSRSRSGAF